MMNVEGLVEVYTQFADTAPLRSIPLKSMVLVEDLVEVYAAFADKTS